MKKLFYMRNNFSIKTILKIFLILTILISIIPLISFFKKPFYKNANKGNIVTIKSSKEYTKVKIETCKISKPNLLGKMNIFYNITIIYMATVTRNN